MSDIIERAEATMQNAHGLPWSTDPSAPEPDDYDSNAWCDVDGSLGGWIAHCQDSDTAFFVACAPGLISELVAELKAARAENERPSRAAIGETEMHYGECLLWVDALEWFIREHSLEVPSWAAVHQAGWRPMQPVDR